MFIQNDRIWTINMLRSTQQAKPPLLNLSVYLAEAEKPTFGGQASSKSTWLRSNKLDFSIFEKVKSCPILFPFLHFDVKSMGRATSWATYNLHGFLWRDAELKRWQTYRT